MYYMLQDQGQNTVSELERERLVLHTKHQFSGEASRMKLRRFSARVIAPRVN